MTHIKQLAGFVLTLTLLNFNGTARGEGDWKSLFNGKDLTGWEGDSVHWSVEDGAITGKTTPQTLLKYNTFLIWKGGDVSDFELRFSYKIVGGNSGVQYRSKVIDQEKYVVGGYQADIDSSPRFTGMNYEEKARGFLAPRGEKVEIAADGQKKSISIGDKDELQKRVKNEDWNEYRIVARGNTLQHFVNDTLMSEVIDHQSEKSSAKGIVALQVHEGPPMTVQFQQIQLKPLN